MSGLEVVFDYLIVWRVSFDCLILLLCTSTNLGSHRLCQYDAEYSADLRGALSRFSRRALRGHRGHRCAH